MLWKNYLQSRYGVESLQEFKGCFSDKAFKAENSRGRRLSSDDPRYSDEDELFGGVVDPFLFDLNKILQSKAYRRLRDKTQVFIGTENCHITTRLKHTSEVMAVAMTLADLLGLNVSLVQAIAAGHDIGHGPYGHLGEKIYFSEHHRPFRHDVFSVVLAQHIERGGRGLNMSYEVLEGISLHSVKTTIMLDKPWEYSTLRVSDKIGFVFGDINDILRNKFMSVEQFPSLLKDFGENQRERVNRMIAEIVVESARQGHLVFEETELGQKFIQLKEWVFQNVYKKIDEDFHQSALKVAYDTVRNCYPGLESVVWPLLTDREVFELARLKLHSYAVNRSMLSHFSVTEIVEAFELSGRQLDKVDIHELDLNW